jgi:hypothetical protein
MATASILSGCSPSQVTFFFVCPALFHLIKLGVTEPNRLEARITNIHSKSQSSICRFEVYRAIYVTEGSHMSKHGNGRE